MATFNLSALLSMNHEQYLRTTIETSFEAFSSGEILIKPPPIRIPGTKDGTKTLDDYPKKGAEAVILDDPDELERRFTIPPGTEILTRYVVHLSKDIVIFSWSGEEPPNLAYYQDNMPSLINALSEISSEIAASEVKPYQEESISVYRKLAAPNKPLYTLLGVIDEIYGLYSSEMFLDIYRKKRKGRYADMRPYVEAALIAAKEITRPREDLHPLISSRYLVSNVRLKECGVIFDAAIITEEAQAQGHWAKPEISSIFKFRREPDFFRQEVALHPYDVLQARALSTAKPEEYGEILGKEVRHFLRQLTWLTIWWYQKRTGDFPFPERLIVAHLRGSLPHLFYCLPLNASFFEQWIEALKQRRQDLKRLVLNESKPETRTQPKPTQIERSAIARRDINELELFRGILIRKWETIAQKEEIKNKGGEIEKLSQWEMA